MSDLAKVCIDGRAKMIEALSDFDNQGSILRITFGRNLRIKL
jgi:hypothetical protein